MAESRGIKAVNYLIAAGASWILKGRCFERAGPRRYNNSIKERV
ncbi:MAG: hypothetical protein M0Z67_14740 [Nitrospiraceae bacterium]|nr:hypothetical protein [Nitrospiraceae bacterium]